MATSPSDFVPEETDPTINLNHQPELFPSRALTQVFISSFDHQRCIHFARSCLRNPPPPPPPPPHTHTLPPSLTCTRTFLIAAPCTSVWTHFAFIRGSQTLHL
eukprot:m.35884 g.35884  ORF g.35884 m.35884 type:complete len:103 (+) comp9936_c0_seq1:2788-3096(+)